MIIPGNDIIFTLGGSAVAACKSCDIEVQCDTIEVSSPTTGDYRTFIKGRKEWGFSSNHLVTSFSDFVMRVGVTYAVIISRRNGTSTDQLSGTVICTKAKVTATRGNLTQGSFTFKGTGAVIQNSTESII